MSISKVIKYYLGIAFVSTVTMLTMLITLLMFNITFPSPTYVFIGVAFGIVPIFVIKKYGDELITFIEFTRINDPLNFSYKQDLPTNVIYQIIEDKYKELDEYLLAKANQKCSKYPTEFYKSIYPYEYKQFFRDKIRENVSVIRTFSEEPCEQIIPFESIVETIVQLKDNTYYYIKHYAGENPFKKLEV